MRLSALESARFGTLALSEPLLFEPGLNILVAPNQAGKSTLLTMVEWMLYGVPARGRQHNQALVELWSPWDGQAPVAELILAPDASDWPEQVRLSVDFAKFAPKLIDAQSLAALDDRFSVDRNGTWDLGQQLTGLSRAAFNASVLAHQDELTKLLTDGELRKLLTTDLAELVEDPERASLDAALNELDDPKFTLEGVADNPVQLPTLLRRAEEQRAMREMERRTAEERFEELEQVLAKREQAEQRQAVEQGKIQKLVDQIAAYDLAAAHWRYGEVERLQAELKRWEGRLESEPWLAQFPHELAGELERWQGEVRAVENQHSARQSRLEAAQAKLAQLEKQLERNKPLEPYTAHLEELAQLSAGLAAALKDQAAADEDVVEHGQVAVPATRKHFDDLDKQLAVHRDYLPQLAEWSQASTSLRERKKVIEQEHDELKALAGISMPWQFAVAAVLLLIALVLGFAGPQFITPTWLAYLLCALAAVGGGWLAVSGAQRRRAADQASIELRKVVLPKREELLAAEAELERQRLALMREQGLSEDAWAELTAVLPEFLSLRLRLERYAAALDERKAAAGRAEQAWARARELMPDAPGLADKDWLDRRRSTLKGHAEGQQQRLDALANLKDLQREVEGDQQRTREVRERLSRLLKPLNLAERARDDAEAAIRTFHSYAREAKNYEAAKGLFDAAEGKARSLVLSREDYERRLSELRPEQRQEVAQLVRDEVGYDRVHKDRRSLQDTLAKVRQSAEHARTEVERLRRQLAKDEDALQVRDQARAEERLARRRLELVQRWQRAITLLSGAVSALQSELASSLSPRVSEELKAILKTAPVAGVTDAGVGPQLELYIKVPDAPPRLGGEELLSRLSVGARQQLALAQRIAVARALGGQARLPLVLDEPLADLDDERAADWVAYLGRLAHEHQVLLTTCHRVQYEWLLRQAKVDAALITLPG